MPRIRFGVNYVPSEKWWYSWTDWNESSIRQDLLAIGGLGMDHIRIHCLWPVFQPNPTYVSETALERLHSLLDLADEAGLDVAVTLFNGWLSGFVFSPSWQGPFWSEAKRNMFTDPRMIEAEKFLLRAVIEKNGGHARFLGIDIGNELGCLQYIDCPVTVEEADKWQAEMLETCEKWAPGKFHVNGVDHTHWFGDVGFSRHGLAWTGAATALHAWIEFTGALRLYPPLGTGCVHLAEYNIELAKAYHTDPSRQVWVQEFGAAGSWMEASDMPSFAEATIRNGASCGNVWGFTWWCSHDISPRFGGFHPGEYELGLFTTGNERKPVGERIAGLIREFRENPPEPVRRTAALVLPDGMFAETCDPPGWRFAKAYMDLIETGIRPAVVLESRLSDTNELEARGITELIRL